MISARPEDATRPEGRPVQPRGGPTVVRMMLGAQLRRLREARNISREQAGRAIRASTSKICRLELGRTPFKRRDVTDLLTLYGVVDSGERETMLALAEQAGTPGWWHQYNDLLPGRFEVYVGLEEAAATIRTYEVQFVHDLLQTEDYARAAIRLRHRGAPEPDVERRVGLRMRRQRLLDQAGGPRLWSVVDESALRRPLGGRAVQRRQIEHLIEAAARPGVTLQVLPFRAGGHPAVGGPFTILRFAEPDLPDVVYLEQLSSALYLDKQEDVDDYTAVMNDLSVQAESARDTVTMLRGILADL
ncbi:helix-turn-helix domain-containing protein [Microbispora hainanensis]|uniref:Helix-turn-helix domain-containing protein n=1 Tax=Microbispora hainanensis TaxID=568844 RepID=A0ABZ1SZX8_9ACTN|nr:MULTISPECIES: helix-turn-helix transcriptional regulator [Microbispora]NJP23144.1 helix-turn-helix domain-containing protein [Microbispora sp. CL1-1]TQS16240.1 helix-turn-helix domain-containing protein [Microbispora sp. SCL1-1]